jgi:hypothetical protein
MGFVKVQSQRGRVNDNVVRASVRAYGDVRELDARIPADIAEEIGLKQAGRYDLAIGTDEDAGWLAIVANEDGASQLVVPKAGKGTAYVAKCRTGMRGFAPRAAGPAPNTIRTVDGRPALIIDLRSASAPIRPPLPEPPLEIGDAVNILRRRDFEVLRAAAGDGAWKVDGKTLTSAQVIAKATDLRKWTRLK